MAEHAGESAPFAQSPAELRIRLRGQLADDHLVTAPGVFDGLSGLVAQDAGFEALYVSGGAVARSTGVPDLGLMTLTEVLVRIREVIDAVDVPVLADADTGYGGALNVARTVREMERIGVAGLHIEDQVTPKKCGHYARKSLVPIEIMTGKIRAAVGARRDPGLVVIARTDAIAVEGFEAALERARQYAEAGADGIFVEAPESSDQLKTIPSSIAAPVVLNMFAGGRTPYLAADQVQALGYAMMIVPSDLQRAAIRAMQLAARTLRADGSTAAIPDHLVSFADRDALVDLDRYQQTADRYEGAVDPHRER